MTDNGEKELEKELYEINFKNINHENYSLKKHHKNKRRESEDFHHGGFYKIGC